ncbi:hypothetical protein [Halobacillus seohaensis]|uniref:Uncharacterized protein n=1 Tax=Halobacillus seohaensis TaxID=447421 RepID=A0ABW2ESI8_9BACI
MKERVEYYFVITTIIIVLFGGIYVSGLMTGVDWGNYSIQFSWNMVNIKEFKQIVGVQ